MRFSSKNYFWLMIHLVIGSFFSAAVFAENLSGVWRVSEQSKFGSSIEYWNISIINNHLSIVNFRQDVPGVPLPGDYRAKLNVYNASFDGQRLSFTINSQDVVTHYDLAFTGPDRIEGYYRSTDTALQDMGIQGKAGVIEDAGKVIMTRQ